MKILIFEYLSGGGFNQTALPASLLAEGELMVRALLDDCERMDTLTVSVMLDWRCKGIANTYDVIPCVISADADVKQVFQDLLALVDAVWLIAPEFDDILQRLTEQVEASGKQLLSSASPAVALTTDKWRTFQCLQAANIPTVSSALLADSMTYQAGQWVIKSRDGVGCMATWRVNNAAEFAETLASINNPHHFIIQPYVEGLTASLSCVFYQGQGWVLCVNEQLLSKRHRNFKLLACKVNSLPILPEYQSLVAQIAEAIPGLYGYVGIDFIAGQAQAENASENYVLDINPRLTSSYVGIYRALGLNMVDLVLQMAQHAPIIQPENNVEVLVSLTD